VKSGDIVSCGFGGKKRKGTFISSRDGMSVVKLDSGYNIGVPPASCTLSEQVHTGAAKRPEIIQNPDLPRLSIVSTGGTIASRIDYRTGSVTSQSDAAAILQAIPELGKIANYTTKSLYTILSENMTPVIWQELARAVFEEIKNGAEGVIVTHGTDTMSFSAAALSFMIDTPVPVIFVGSQRSADRPSSDNAMNAVCAAKAATSDLGEVAVVMHTTTNDDTCSIHRGTRVRKMHTSRRDAFQSIGIPPIGSVAYPSLEIELNDDAVKRGSCKPALHDKLDDRCALVYFYPGMSPDILMTYEGYHGLILAGTGLGHVSTTLIPVLRKLIESGTIVMMTSQCLQGKVCDRVYDTGRDLLEAGVIEGADILPEVALVKMMWVLGNEKDPMRRKDLLQTNLKGECNRRGLHGL
jgi:glutamyl-tRNA(Gln) amidotransferase subunit D